VKQHAGFRYVQVSTDEVYGSLGPTGRFSETTPMAPNSPYSSSKAAGDLLVRAWHHTYGLPAITTNCSNNYGPRQYPEKLIPTMITNALAGKPLPVYGDGGNVRDWIHVEDHSAGISLALERGRPGETYCFGGDAERNNLQVVRAICAELDALQPRADGRPHDAGIAFVTDRLGHDRRYAIDDTKASTELGFTRRYANFEQGLAQTVRWYLDNQDWCRAVTRKVTAGV
jgi:dTDP-glucose 4,6-dehydratase